MKVFLDQFCLSQGGDESPAELSVNGRNAVQEVPLLRGSTAAIFARGGRINTVEFAVVRQHTSHGAAEGFLFFHAAMLPPGGTLTFLCEDADGAAVRYVAEAAAVASDQGTQAGVTTTHRYTLRCGAIRGGELSTFI